MFAAIFSKSEKCIETVHSFVILNHIMAYKSVTNENFHYFSKEVWKNTEDIINEIPTNLTQKNNKVKNHHCQRIVATN